MPPINPFPRLIAGLAGTKKRELSDD